MKKFFSILLCVLLTFSLLNACQKQPSGTDDVIVMLGRVEPFHDGEKELYQYDFVLDAETYVQPEKNGETQEFFFHGKRYELLYEKTISRGGLGSDADYYQISNGGEKGYVELFDSGRTLISAQELVKIDISPTADETEIIAALQKEFGEELRLDQYQQWDCEFSQTEEEQAVTGKFGYCKVSFYQTFEGYRISESSTSFMVLFTGEVRSVLIGDPTASASVDSIDGEKIRSAVEKKLNGTFPSLLSYDIKNATITTYKEKPCLLFALDVQYRDPDSQTRAEIIYLLAELL